MEEIDAPASQRASAAAGQQQQRQLPLQRLLQLDSSSTHRMYAYAELRRQGPDGPRQARSMRVSIYRPTNVAAIQPLYVFPYRRQICRQYWNRHCSRYCRESVYCCLANVLAGQQCCSRHGRAGGAATSCCSCPL